MKKYYSTFNGKIISANCHSKKQAAILLHVSLKNVTDEKTAKERVSSGIIAPVLKRSIL